MARKEDKQPQYLPLIVKAKLHTGGRDYEKIKEELKGQGFTCKQMKGMVREGNYFDGIVLYLSKWNWDNHESWHLYNWDDKDDKEVMLDQSRPQQTRFKKFLDGLQQEYDYCIIDNAPDINISTINALVASQDVMVPITIDDFAIDGLAELKEQIDNTREDLNPQLRFCGCFVTQYDRTNEADTQGEEFLKTLEYPVFETHIRKTPKMKPSTFERLPIILYSPRCGASADYKALVEEWLRM